MKFVNRKSCCGSWVKLFLAHMLPFCLVFLMFMATLSCASPESPALGNRTSEDPPVPALLAVGDQAETAQVRVTVYAAEKITSYTWSTGHPGDTRTHEAPTGKIWVLLSASVRCIAGDGKVIVTRTNFVLTDSDDTLYQASWDYKGAGEFHAGELRPGEVLEGKMLFAIPASAAGLLVTYGGVAHYDSPSWRLPF